MKLNITVDGKTYEVDVEVSEPEHMAPVPVGPVGQVRLSPTVPVAPAVSNGASTPVADESKVCRSPINGTVVRVVAEPGQKVEVGDVLLVLEAMKMQTEITAPVAATVAKIDANVGDPVRSGHLLVEFE